MELFHLPVVKNCCHQKLAQILSFYLLVIGVQMEVLRAVPPERFSLLVTPVVMMTASAVAMKHAFLLRPPLLI